MLPLSWRPPLPYITANGVPHYYELEGHGQPVLFIHGGFGGAESTLYPQPSAINGLLSPDRFQTIGYDRRNCGRSGYITGAYRLEDLGDDAYELLQALRAPRAIVVGDSLGGMVAQRLAIDHPDAVTTLVLLETAARVLRRTKRVSAMLVALRILGPRFLFRRFRHRFLNPSWSTPIGPSKSESEHRAIEARRADYLQKLRGLPEDDLYRYSLGLIRTYVAFSGRDLSEDVYRITAPAHVIHGAADTIVTLDKGRALQARIPRATLTELPSLGHGLPYYPEARRVLRDVIERNSIGPSPS